MARCGTARRAAGLAAGLTEQQRYLLGDCVEAYIDVDEEISMAFQRQLEAEATGKVKP